MSELTTSETRLLEGINLFSGLRASDLASIAAAARRINLQAEQYLYFEGDPAKHIYALLQGRVRLTQVTTEGQQIIFHHVSPGEAFGVLAVLIEALYPVTAQAVEPSLCLSWDQDTMKELLGRHPQTSINAIGILAGRIRDFQDRIRELSTERVERRIARTLIRLANQAGKKVPEGVLIDLSLSRQDLAEMTGTTLFTVSRTLSQWEAKGLIQSGRERILIRFPHGLVSIAEDLPVNEPNPPDS